MPSPPEFTAKIAHLSKPRPGGGQDLITCWVAVSDATGEPLPGEGTGPARVGGYTLTGDWDGKPTPWLAKEYIEQLGTEPRLRRATLDQVMDRVRQERGILRIGEHLVYDLSVWHHWSGQELRVVGSGPDGKPRKAWRDTYTCKRCSLPLESLRQSPWWAADGDTECHGEVWIP